MPVRGSRRPRAPPRRCPRASAAPLRAGGYLRILRRDRRLPPYRGMEATSTFTGNSAKRKSMRQGPLAGRYPAAAAMVMFALIPYLALSAAIGPVTPIIGRDLHMSPQAMSLGSGMANAAYAIGTVIAVQF